MTANQKSSPGFFLSPLMEFFSTQSTPPPSIPRLKYLATPHESLVCGSMTTAHELSLVSLYPKNRSSLYNHSKIRPNTLLFNKPQESCYIFTGVPANNAQTKIRYRRISLRRLGTGSSRKESRFIAAGKRMGRSEAGNVAFEDRTRRSQS